MIRSALILAAGLGTRLAPLSAIRAKAALPVAGDAIIRRQVGWLAAAGVRRVIVNLHHLPATVTGVLGHGDDLGVAVRYSWEPRVLGSAGGPRQAFALVDDEQLIVVNGDTITDLDLASLVAAHEARRPLVTMAVTAARPGYNALLVDAAGQFTGVRPAGANPSAESAGLDPVHFMGVQIMERRACASLAPGVAAETVKALYPALAAHDPASVVVWRSHASFFDVGTPAEYLRTAQAIAAGLGLPLDRGPGTQVDATADVSGSVLWNGVHVGAGAVVRDCVVADGVTVPSGTVLERATVVRRAHRVAAAGDVTLGDTIVVPFGAVAVPFGAAAK